MVTHNTMPFILVVHTKAEYNTDHSELVYNQSYIDKKTKDYRKIRNPEKKEIEKEFLETLKIALELQNQIDIFRNSLNTKYPDWLAFSRITDLYYDIRTLKDGQVQKLNAVNDPVALTKYRNLYHNVITDVDLWFNSELLTRARSIAEYMAVAPADSDFSLSDAGTLYRDIELLDFYRDRVKQTQIQGKLPKEIESLETYSLANRILFSLETALFRKEFQAPPTLNNDQKKRWLLNKSTNLYPLCRLCSSRVGDKITEIENLTHEENIMKYRKVSADYYANLGCFEKVYAELDSIIRSNADSLTISPFMLKELKQDKAALDDLANSYVDIVGRDYTVMSREELSQLLSRYYVNRDKLQAVMQRLRGAVIKEEEISCL